MTNARDLYEIVTPAKAEAILTRNTHNRPLRSGVAEKYARDMKAGHWKKNGETVKIAKDGTLLDGQHRLYAVIEADTPVPMIILRDIDEDAIATIDTGVPRSYGDYISITNNTNIDPIKNRTVFAATLRLIDWYEKRWPSLGFRTAVATHQELDELHRRHPQLSEFVNTVAAKSGRIVNIVSLTRLAFVYAMAAEADPTRAQHWLSTLASGEGNTNNPAVALRNRLVGSRLAGNKLDAATELCFLIKSWNAFARDETLAQYRWLPDEPMPAILGTVQYTGRHAGRSAVKRERAKRAGSKAVKRYGVRGKTAAQKLREEQKR